MSSSFFDELLLDFGTGFNNAGQDQPVAASPNPSALESSNAQSNEKLRNLKKILNSNVDEQTSKLKSQSFEQPKPYIRGPIILTDALEATRRSRGPTVPAGKLPRVCFKLPEAFDWDGLDAEKREREREREREEEDVGCPNFLYVLAHSWCRQRQTRIQMLRPNASSLSFKDLKAGVLSGNGDLMEKILTW
ncbi:unnamed protein product [Prunus armeniaca]|uniref:Uncharacterized protein n=1 Tax=Prunus armeniaca TaxID=36596 RepID=A0A6J5U5J2_PRUAR|nr:unnamed protein product [Prunus armeniaca]CAB4300817.1 unnamed protein product [Prunus armeniaca]